MANTKQIRSKIKSVKNLQKIIKALEVVSTIKLQKLKDKTDKFKTFVLDFLNVLQSMKDQINIFDFNKKSRDPDGKRLLIVITSDK
ncbi:F0F1 ATP synthase subunit gamma [Patescibacteria group bacterium]|nr:F0F1 ATP synthase subunit gamma [Patescibacteria group bacterium]MBU1758163.1 F0F1 ATP synthase subunit gamma [Patescibacteria group bacterium]